MNSEEITEVFVGQCNHNELERFKIQVAGWHKRDEQRKSIGKVSDLIGVCSVKSRLSWLSVVCHLVVTCPSGLWNDNYVNRNLFFFCSCFIAEMRPLEWSWNQLSILLRLDEVSSFVSDRT